MDSSDIALSNARSKSILLSRFVGEAYGVGVSMSDAKTSGWNGPADKLRAWAFRWFEGDYSDAEEAVADLRGAARYIEELEDDCMTQSRNAASYCVQLSDAKGRIAELEAAQRWIPVSERLPESGRNVLCLHESGGIGVDHTSGQIFTCERETVEFDGYVTHWMPLPLPPEQAE